MQRSWRVHENRIDSLSGKRNPSPCADLWFFFCLLLSVLESWLDYTGELEPPEPLARLPQLKHRMKRLLTQLGKVQQIALYSSTWGCQRTAAASVRTVCRKSAAEEAHWSLAAKIMILVQVQDLDRSARALWPWICCCFSFWKRSVRWNPMLQSASVIYEYLYEQLWKVGILNQDWTQKVTS